MSSVVSKGEGKVPRKTVAKAIKKNQNVETPTPDEVLGADKNFMNAAPKAKFPKDKKDDYWAMMKDLQDNGAFGPDRLLGAREYSPDYVKYVKAKKDEEIQGALYDLIESAYDPLDPVQSRMVQTLAPQLKNARLSYIDRVLEQREFLLKVAHSSHFSDDTDSRFGEPASAMDKMMRLVNVLGGAEELLALDAEKAIVTPGVATSVKWEGALKGLLTFGYIGEAGRGAGASLSGGPISSRGSRVQIARTVLHLFPAYLTGKYNVMSGSASTARAGPDPDALVDRCEAIVNKDVSIGQWIGGSGAVLAPGRKEAYGSGALRTNGN